jgi:uncharacterized protein with NRDE domain
MCLVAFFFRVVEDAPLIVGANREEAYARGGEPPRILPGVLRAAAGVDPRAAGTWFGINERGVVVAITNRFKSDLPPNPRSRGLLARDLLDCPTAQAASALAAREIESHRYAGCNILCADAEAAHVLHSGDWLRVRPLPPGVHVLTRNDVNDENDPRTGHALWWLTQRSYLTASHCTAALKELCAQCGNHDPPICLHGKEGGTVSSSIVVVRSPLKRGQYWHAQGSPDSTPYQDYSHLLAELSSPQTQGGQ